VAKNMIRKATIKDIKAIYALLVEGLSTGKVLKRSMKELESVINNFFVYEENNTVVGCCSLEIYTHKLAEIRSLVVSSEYQQRGIGSALVQRCREEAKRKKVYQILSVTDKQGFFERVGFRTEVNEKQAMLLYLGLKGGKAI